MQRAISQRKLTGYNDGAVVPYARSQSVLREHCPCNTGFGDRNCMLNEWSRWGPCLSYAASASLLSFSPSPSELQQLQQTPQPAS